MLVEKSSRVLLLCAVVTLGACATQPPDADVAAARSALESARTARADEYAPDSMRAAQEAQSALETELKVQESKWVKSYDHTKELALAAKSTADEAASAAATGRTKKDAEAAAARERAAAAAAERVKASAVRVGGQIRPPVKTKNVQPVYPEIAKSARVGGTVQVEATIGADGKVVDARVVRSVPLLDQAALDAVRQWEYQPSTLNGRAVPVVVMVNVNFAMP